MKDRANTVLQIHHKEVNEIVIKVVPGVVTQVVTDMVVVNGVVTGVVTEVVTKATNQEIIAMIIVQVITQTEEDLSWTKAEKVGATEIIATGIGVKEMTSIENRGVVLAIRPTVMTNGDQLN